MTNQEKYAQRVQRVSDAVALKEPDTIPFIPIVQCFPYLQAGYTMAEILYDMELTKARDSLFKYLDEYDPDVLMGHSYVNMGQGPINELGQPKTSRWAGMPGNVIDENSIHQFIEFPVLEDADFDRFTTDRSGWVMNLGMPRTSGVLEPFARFDVANMGVFGSHSRVAAVVSTPEFKNMMQTLWKINDLSTALQARVRQLDADIEAYGYPILATGFAGVPFDGYSDFLRGTLDGCADLYERPEIVMAYCEEQL